MPSDLINQLNDQVNDRLKAVLSSRDMDLYGMMSYHLGWGSRPGIDPQADPATPPMRRHGVGCLVAALATSGSYEAALPAAAAVEMVASFVEIHDDIQGGRPARNGRDAVWWVWGPAQAINAGDGMHALARLVMLDLQNGGVNPEVTFRATQVLDEASLEMCEGRFKDMEAQERIDMSVVTYLEMARAKSGSLMAGAMRLGALVGSGGDDAIAEAFGACGVELGVAMQAAGDIAELFPTRASGAKSPLSEEVLNKKKLLPVVHAIENAGASERRRLGDVYFKRVLEPADVVEVQNLVLELGGRERADEVASEHRAAAIKVLEGAGISAQGQASVEAFADALMRAE
jgi:geranylgeranyl diphosphate synthase type I